MAKLGKHVTFESIVDLCMVTPYHRALKLSVSEHSSIEYNMNLSRTTAKGVKLGIKQESIT